MKERGKALKSSQNDAAFPDTYYTSSSELPCRKHPTVSCGGICPYCLNDRLMNLVCADCGEQRLSSCSCSDLSSADVGSVGRISFLIENEKNTNNNNNEAHTKKAPRTEEVLFLKRSSSSCVEIKKKHKFWRIVGLLRKVHGKKDRDFEAKSVVNHGGFDGRSDSWVVDYNNNSNHNSNFNGNLGVSRSRSLCSFRGGALFGSEDGSYSYSRSSISAARSSSVNGGLGFDAEPRRSGFEGRRSNFSETEHRKSGVSETEPRRSFFEGRKSNFSETEHRKSGFSESEPKGRKSNFSESEPRRSFVDGRRSNFSESEPRRSFFEGRKSNFSESEPRKSCFDGRKSNFSETEHRKSGFSETEHRKSNFMSVMDCDSKSMRKNGSLMDLDSNGLTRRVFSLKESYFTGGEDSGFIDLKFDMSTSESRTEQYSGFGSMRCSDNFRVSGDNGDLGILDHGGGSCREIGGERGIKKSRKSFKGWRWIFKQSPNWINGGNMKKKDEDAMVNHPS